MKKVFKIDKDYIDSRLDRWFKKKYVKCHNH